MLPKNDVSVFSKNITFSKKYSEMYFPLIRLHPVLPGFGTKEAVFSSVKSPIQYKKAVFSIKLADQIEIFSKILQFSQKFSLFFLIPNFLEFSQDLPENFIKIFSNLPLFFYHFLQIPKNFFKIFLIIFQNFHKARKTKNFLMFLKIFS